MFRRLQIRNFRAFEDFQMHDLGRVNLLVGRNNCGKTSVLEAIQMLASGDPFAIWQTARRRGEQVSPTEDRRAGVEIDVSHFFHGHSLSELSKFEIIADEGTQFIASVVPGESSEDSSFDETSAGTDTADLEDELEQPLALHLVWFEGGEEQVHHEFGITWKGIVTREMIRRRSIAQINDVGMITTEGLSPYQIINLFDNVSLTPEEDKVIAALKTIEPGIERIATAVSEYDRLRDVFRRGGIKVKCAGFRQPIPIGTMGDGIWRLLGLALTLAKAENGFVLIDEIDTGLHYSVMDEMWRMVVETARRLNVQVFATSHSRDCYESLAVIARELAVHNADISIQRIERDRAEAIAFTDNEIVVAAERGLEVR